tara:strand:+ start:572 stop:1120 length:549 start_codon:yes stop_codon:yes gene_type:complete
MNTTITAICDLATHTWEVNQDLKPTNGAVLKMGFRRGNEISGLTFAEDFRFGLKVERTTDPSKEDIVLDMQFPRKGHQIVTSTSEIILIQDAIMEIADDFKVSFWVKENGGESDTSTDTTIPLPEQPYPSWRWDGIMWYAPGEFPMPPEDEDPTVYSWSEEKQSWVKDVRDPEEVWDLPETV